MSTQEINQLLTLRQSTDKLLSRVQQTTRHEQKLYDDIEQYVIKVNQMHHALWESCQKWLKSEEAVQVQTDLRATLNSLRETKDKISALTGANESYWAKSAMTTKPYSQKEELLRALDDMVFALKLHIDQVDLVYLKVFFQQVFSLKSEVAKLKEQFRRGYTNRQLMRPSIELLKRIERWMEQICSYASNRQEPSLMYTVHLMAKNCKDDECGLVKDAFIKYMSKGENYNEVSLRLASLSISLYTLMDVLNDIVENL